VNLSPQSRKGQVGRAFSLLSFQRDVIVEGVAASGLRWIALDDAEYLSHTQIEE
jgi:hypothetical protein